MDELTPLDRQIAGELLLDAGPPESVDDLAIFSIITATRSPKWHSQSMLGATKFVVAGAIVALFGGFLLAGLLAQPTDERLPPTATADLLETLETEEVGPGVFHVLSDGIDDLSAIGEEARTEPGLELPEAASWR